MTDEVPFQSGNNLLPLASLHRLFLFQTLTVQMTQAISYHALVIFLESQRIIMVVIPIVMLVPQTQIQK